MGQSWTPTKAEAAAASPGTVRSLAIVARVAAATVIVIGAGTLVGWAADIGWLKGLGGRFRYMAPNTAMLLVFCGLSLGLSLPPSARRRRVWAARALAAACCMIALSTLAQDLLGRDFGIDALLFDASPARASAPVSVALALAGAALLLLDVRPRHFPSPTEVLAGAAAVIGVLTLGGYLYGAAQFYTSRGHPHPAGMAVRTAAALVVLGIGILAARPSSGAMAIVTSPLVGGQVVRKLFLIVLALPVLGFLAARAERAGLYDPPGAAIVESVADVIVAGLMALAVGSSLNRADAERRRTEEEVCEWKRFFDRATFGAVFGTVDGKLGRINEAYARMQGFTVAELEGTPIADRLPPHRRAELAENLRITYERGHCRWETELVCKDGSLLPVVADVSAVRDEQGNVLYRAAYIQDITEEKRAASVRARLASLVESADDAIVSKTLDGTVLDWNHAAERLYGYTAEEMIGSSITAIVPQDHRAEREAILATVLRGETVVGYETVHVRKDGRRVPIALTLSPIRDAVGQVVGISTIARDISLLKQLEQEREEWSAIVAHDLRQPAAAIRLGVEMLAKVEGPAKQNALDRIRRASRQLERMIEDLLDVSRVEAHRLAVRPEEVSVPALIAEALDLAPHIAVRCRAEVDPEAARAFTDPGRFNQVLSNLLSNADKYSDPGTPIEVRVARSGEMVEVSVTNVGPGIAPDETPLLFSRFARTRSARAGTAPGLGLGLYICRGLVEALGGKLWMESVPGDKTHFRFTSPRAAAREEKLTA